MLIVLLQLNIPYTFLNMFLDEFFVIDVGMFTCAGRGAKRVDTLSSKSYESPRLLNLFQWLHKPVLVAYGG